MNSAKRNLKKLEDEEWKFIPGTNNRYMVSSYGRIKSFVIEPVEGRILKCSTTKGFSIANFKIDKKNKQVCVHKLVAELWLDKPSNQHTLVTHIDHNLKNNHFSNLKWLTLEECNIRYRDYFSKKYNSPTHTRIVTNSKLKEKDVFQLKSMLKRGVAQSTIAKLFCISEMQVTRIKRGENWGHIQP